MTDREMLELAAKAAGIELGEDRIDCGVSVTDADGRHRSLPQWNPLNDAGDALRLAVDLRIDLTHCEPGCIIASHAHGDIKEGYGKGSDPLAATRRAIVRAAAEIGRTK